MKKNRIGGFLFAALVFSLLVGCANRKYITSSGLHSLKLGDEMPELGISRWKGHSARDTFEVQGDYQWREIVVEYKKGNVYLEEDFYGSAHLARVRVYTPELVLRNGLRVGMTVSDLQAKATDWTLVPLPEYNLMDLYSRTMPRIHFLVDDPAIPKNGDWTEYKIEQLAPTALIKAIVVF
jgi:hypothetical protein